MDKKSIANNRNDFIVRLNPVVYQDEMTISKLNRELAKMYVEPNLRLENPNKAYRDRIMSFNDELKEHGVEYFGGDFFLRKVYESTLVSLVNEAQLVSKELVTKMDEIARFSHKHERIFFFLAKKGYYSKKLEPLIKQYNSYSDEIEHYDLGDNLKNLLIKKYRDGIDPSKTAPGRLILLYGFDKYLLKKIGLEEKVKEIDVDICTVIYFKEMEIAKTRKVLKKEGK